jgi:hypothetical protein
MSFQDLLTIGRNQLLEGLRFYQNKNENKNKDKNNTAFFDFTGCEDFFFDVLNRPFFNHIYFLNYFVFTAHSSVYSWNPSNLYGLCIAFYVPIELLTSLKEECEKNNYKLTICGKGYKKDQLLLTNSRAKNNTDTETKVIYDFTNLLPTVELVEVYDTNPTNKNLYYKLFKWFSTQQSEQQLEQQKQLKEELLEYDWIYDNFQTDYYNLLDSELKGNFQPFLDVLEQFETFKKEDVEIVETGLLVRRYLIELLIRKDFFDKNTFITILRECGFRVVDVREFVNEKGLNESHEINDEKYKNYDSIAIYNDGVALKNPELTNEKFYQKVYEVLLNTAK